MSPGDRRALRVLCFLIALGGAVRLSAPRSGPAGAVAYSLANQPLSADSALSVAQRVGRPLVSGERVDINTAGPSDLERLPGIGAGLAGRIVSHRAAYGQFRSVDGLTAVPGIGPVLAGRLRSWITVGAVAGSASLQAPAGQLVAVNRVGEEELQALPGIGPGRARAIIEYRNEHGPFRNVDDLTQIRGIGPAIVERLRARVKIP